MNNMNPFKRIPIFLSLCLALVAGITTTQAQFNTGAGTKLVLIDSFSDFASVQPSNNTKSVIVVRYGSAEGDQLGGTFMYDSTSAASADGLNVFVPPSGVGRFLRFDNAVYVPGTQTASRVIVSDGSGNVGTDTDLAFDGSNLTVGGNVTVSTLSTGTTDNVVTKNGSNVLETRIINPDVWNVAADLDGSGTSGAATGARLIGPSLFFDGTDDFVAIADDAKLSFTDGTDDQPFSITAWVKSDDLTTFTAAAKYEDGAGEWIAGTDSSDNLMIFLSTSSGNRVEVISTDPVTSYEGDWVHLGWTYGGAGATSASGEPFATAGNQVNLFVNGAAVATDAPSYAGTYAGMQDTADALWIARRGTDYAEGHIGEVRIFNRQLSAAEVLEAMNSDLGFVDEWAAAIGGAETSDFSAGTDSYTASNGALAGNVDSIGSRDDNLRLTVDNTASIHQILSPQVMTIGKNYRVSFDYYVPTQSNVDGIQVNLSSTVSDSVIYTEASPTLDTWTRGIAEGIATSNQRVYFTATDGGVTTVTDAGGDDLLYVRNIVITEVGTLADLRAESFDESTGKLYDFSNNAYVGVNSGSTLTGRVYPVYETGTWTPTVTFGGGSTGITYTAQEGYYTRIGDTVVISGVCTISAVGSSTGTARIAGFPFTSKNMTATSFLTSSVAAFNMTGLTSALTALIEDNQPNAILYDAGATGSAVIDHSNFTATSSIRFSATYQLQ